MSIPLNTPPGTLIVCVDDSIRHDLTPWNTRSTDLRGLVRGKVYELAAIEDCGGAPTAVLVGVKRSHQKHHVFKPNGFHVNRFRLAVLPKALTDILTSAPIKTKERA